MQTNPDGSVNTYDADGNKVGTVDAETVEKMTTFESDEDAALVNLICVNLDEYARAYNDKAVKKTLSIPAWLNTACENYGINYSKVLQDALIAKIQARS